MNLMPILRGWPFDKDDTASKSYTVVYVKNATASQSGKTFASNSIGCRQTGDQLIYFESRNVTNVSRFPSRAFEYSGDDLITYVGFAFNVRFFCEFYCETFMYGNSVFYSEKWRKIFYNKCMWRVVSTEMSNRM